MPPAERLIGKCKRRFLGVCTSRANFSNHLEKIEPSRNVFLYDVSQLRDNDVSRSSRFLMDLSEFLELPKALERPMIWIKPGQRATSTEERKMIASKRIDICDGKYSELRSVLMKEASFSASWILGSFIKNQNVKVSSSRYFAQILDTWHKDPCDHGK